MFRAHGYSAAAAVALAIIAFCAAAPARAQDAGTTVKTQATLAPPVGATNTAAKGKAKTLYRDNGQSILQKLSITLEHLTRRTDYRVAIDGVVLGVVQPKGNSGTLRLRFRTPPKGNQDSLPVGLVDTRAFQVVEVFNDQTGELVLTGTFAVVPEE